MANSAFRIAEGKRYESSFGECSGSTFTVNQSNYDEVNKISDVMILKYENNQCPVVGDVVRWSSINNALTLADAEYNVLAQGTQDPEASSEVIGVIEEVINACGSEFNRNEVKARVVMFGKIDFTNHMGTKQLTPGKVYYLNDSTEKEHNHPDNHVFRNATTREPEMVSKPVYIATSQSTAIVTNFRGLMGGQSDYTVDEILLNIVCDEVGFFVTIKNNGSEDWKTPIDNISSQYDPMDGSTAVGEINKHWGSYNELGEWKPGIDPMLQTASLSLIPGEQVSYRVGTDLDKKIGKLEVTLNSGTQARANKSKICIPKLSIISECADSPQNESGLPRFLIKHTNGPAMTSPISYIIQEKNSLGEYSNVTDQDHVDFILPSTSGDDTWFINVYDKYDPSHSGDYRIVFPDIVNGHWAYEELGEGMEMSCITEIKCLCDESPNCLIEPRDIEKRKTYGPVETAFELDGQTQVGSASENPTKYPGLYLNQPYDASFTEIKETKSVWMGSTSRVNEDGTNGRFCGSIIESGSWYSLNFTFSIPNDGAFCIPKLTPDQVKAGAPYLIEIWKNKSTQEVGFPALFSLSIGDVPRNPVTATVFINYDETNGQYQDCFDITIDGRSQEYFIDEMVT